MANTLTVAEMLVKHAPKPSRANGTGHPYLYVSYKQRAAMIAHVATKYKHQLPSDDCATLSKINAMLWQADGCNIDINDTPDNKRK